MSIPTPHTNRSTHVPSAWGRRAAGAAGGLALLGASALLAPGTAGALPTNCTQARTTVTCTYNYTGGEQIFDVPAGVTSLNVTAVGARGETSDDNRRAAPAATVTGTIPVTAGSLLYVEVGGGGIRRLGGFNGGGNGGTGAGGFGTPGQGGGGASDVRTAPRATANSLSTRMLVAAGSGGAGGSIGAGGNATATSGGQPSGTGTAGTVGVGGTGGSALSGGSGGGGGLYGGGGGAGGSGSNPSSAGGMGSNLVPARGGTSNTTDGPAAVTISYSTASSTPPSPCAFGSLCNLFPGS